MPRKSAAELAIVPRLADHHRRITAPDGMTPEETALFKKIVEGCHLCILLKPTGRCCEPMCQSVPLVSWLFLAAQQSPDALGDWERCVRVQAALSVKLRLNPHSRADPKTVMRTVAGHSQREVGVTSKAWPRSAMAAGAAGGRGVEHRSKKKPRAEWGGTLWHMAGLKRVVAPSIGLGSSSFGFFGLDAANDWSRTADFASSIAATA